MKSIRTNGVPVTGRDGSDCVDMDPSCWHLSKQVGGWGDGSVKRVLALQQEETSLIPITHINQTKRKVGMVAHACSPCTEESETQGS